MFDAAATCKKEEIEVMSYLVLAYPTLSSSDFERIQHFRKAHDELYYQMVKPHFTFVFPTGDIRKSEFIQEVRTQLEGEPAFPVVLREAIVHKDSLTAYYYSFLLPEEGNDRIIHLHDKLYKGRLNKYLLTDPEYVPHITIGNSRDLNKVERMTSHWNEMGIVTNGNITSLVIASLKAHHVENILEIPLGPR